MSASRIRHTCAFYFQIRKGEIILWIKRDLVQSKHHYWVKLIEGGGFRILGGLYFCWTDIYKPLMFIEPPKPTDGPASV